MVCRADYNDMGNAVRTEITVIGFGPRGKCRRGDCGVRLAFDIILHPFCSCMVPYPLAQGTGI